MLTEEQFKQQLREAGLLALLKGGAQKLLAAGAGQLANKAFTQAIQRGSQMLSSKTLETFEQRIDVVLQNMAKELQAANVDDLRKSLSDANFKKTVDPMVLKHLEMLFTLKDKLKASAQIARSVQTRVSQGIPPVIPDPQGGVPPVTTDPQGGVPPVITDPQGGVPPVIGTAPAQGQGQGTPVVNFQPKQFTVIRAEGTVDKPLMDGYVYQYFNKQWYLVKKNGLEPIKYPKLLDKLNKLAKDGRDDKNELTKQKAGTRPTSPDIIKQLRKESYQTYKQFFV